MIERTTLVGAIAVVAAMASLATAAPVALNLQAEWRADQGITQQGTDGNPNAVETADTWDDVQAGTNEWTAVDEAGLPGNDWNLVPTGATGVPFPDVAISKPDTSIAAAYFQHGPVVAGSSNAGQPVTFEMWFRSNLDSPPDPFVLFETGASANGASMTIGDGGVIGDDDGAGRNDDLRFVLGGNNTAPDRSITVDMPNDWDEHFVHIVGVYNSTGAGDMAIYLDGVVADQLALADQTTGIIWEGGADAGMFGDFGNGTGAVGNDGDGTDDADEPFVNQQGLADTWPAAAVGIFRWYDRGLTPVEVAANYNGELVPEPATLTLIGMGGLLMVRRRRA